MLCLCGCTKDPAVVNVPGKDPDTSPSVQKTSSPTTEPISDGLTALSSTPSIPNETATPEAVPDGLWDNTPYVLVPTAPAVLIIGNETATIDYSNSSEGYVVVSYNGTNPKVKFRFIGPDGVRYMYNLHGGPEVIPITAGNGNYDFTVLENTTGKNYATAFAGSLNLNVTNTFGPYLYPNQYVNFNSNSSTVAKASELAKGAANEVDVVASIYTFVTTTIKYDYAFADIVEGTYIPTPDNTLATGMGICSDYSSLMCAMLRSQRIPTQLVYGYAGDSYHAWINVYTKDSGWINGIIRFDGNKWILMDPTYTANAGEKAAQKFIGEGNNYSSLYIY